MSGPARRYAFLTTPRWLRLIAVLVAVAVACVLMGRWQWTRYESRSAEAEHVNAVWDDAAAPLVDVVPDRVVTDDNEWRAVTMTGRWVEGATVELRNRPVDGQAAVHAVAPFVTELAGEGVVVVVDRGWLPASDAEAGLPEPPSGTVEVTGRLRAAGEPDDRTSGGRVYSLHPETVLAAAKVDAAQLPALDGYVVAEGEGAPLRDQPRPEFAYALNVSYTIQWGLFAVGAIVALVVLARREAAERSGHGPIRRPTRDEVEEDLEVLGLRRPAGPMLEGRRRGELGRERGELGFRQPDDDAADDLRRG